MFYNIRRALDWKSLAGSLQQGDPPQMRGYTYTTLKNNTNQFAPINNMAILPHETRSSFSLVAAQRIPMVRSILSAI
jgi:hypothetical protein